MVEARRAATSRCGQARLYRSGLLAPSFRDELVVQRFPEAPDHEPLDDRHHALTLGLGFVNEADAHAGLLFGIRLLGTHRPLHASMQLQRLVQLRYLKLEDE